MFGDLWMWLQLMWLQFEVVRGPVGGRLGINLGAVWGPKGRKPAPNRPQLTPDRTSDDFKLQPQDLEVLKMIFIFLFLTPPPGPGGGSGLPFSLGDRRFWADSGPNPGIF